MSRKAICLWILAAAVCVALAAGGAGLAQQSGRNTPAADPFSSGASDTFDAAEAGTPGGGASTLQQPSSSSQNRPQKATGYAGGSSFSASGQPASGPGPGGMSGGYDGGQYYGAAEQNPYGSGPLGYGEFDGYSRISKRRGRRPDPEMEKLLKEDARMEAHAQSLINQWREAEDEKARGEVRSELETLTKEHFDLRQKRRELELSRLEAQLERVRASIKKRTEAKDLIIQRRISRLLGEEDDLAF